MVKTNRSLLKSQRLLVIQRGLFVETRATEQYRQIVERRPDVWMIGSERLFSNCQSPLIKLYRLGVPSLLIIQLSQIVQRRRHIWMVKAECLFPNLERLFVRTLRLIKAPFVAIQFRQII